MAYQSVLTHLWCVGGRNRISAHRDMIRRALWGAAAVLAAAAAVLRSHLLLPAITSTGPPFLTLAIVIAAGLALDHVGIFSLLARIVVPTSATNSLAVVGVLSFTALLSGLVNLDVAVVVALPLALGLARQRQLNASRLAIAAAITANATSFLLPTSNLTTLLILGRTPPSFWTYLGQSWMAWLLVTAATVGALSFLVNRRDQRFPGTSAPIGDELIRSTTHEELDSLDRRQEPSAVGLGTAAMALADLVPMFLGAAAIRACLGGGIALHGGPLGELGLASLFAAAANNLPAASAIVAGGGLARWAVVLGLAIGPNLLVTGSVASLIARRIAIDHGAEFGALKFSLIGTALLPLQFCLALTGLWLTVAH